MRQVQITEKEEEDAEIKERTLNGKEKIEYVFGDFLRGFYLLGSVFFDVVVVGFLYTYIPDLQFYEGIYSTIFHVDIFAIYVLLATLFAEIILVVYEIKGFRRFFNREGHFL